MRLWLYPFGSRARNQGCMNPPSLRVPAQESEGGSSKKSGQLLVPPSTKIPPPHPLLPPWADKPTLSGIPDPSRQLGLETMLSPRWLLREGGASGCGGWSGDGGGAGSELTPLEEAPVELSFPKRMNPFRARKEGEKTLSGI